jgi:mono/diheme cytochrome c family protein
MVRVLAAASFALMFGYAAAIAWADEGSAIFQAKCSACHTIGKGKLVGPDLKGISNVQSRAWLERWISSPSAMIKSGDPTATNLVKQYPMQMPDLGLSPSDVDAVITYLAQQSGGGGGTGAAANAAPAAAPAVKLPPGDAEAGRELFVGNARLKNGGPPCMSCHSISGIGALGGGTLGPDLTSAFKDLGGESGIASFLSTTPTPTMSAVWSKHPLTPQEIANLAAFIKEGAVAARPLNALAELIVLAVIGAIILVIIAATYWRRRLRGVRIPLVARANAIFLSRQPRRL